MWRGHTGAALVRVFCIGINPGARDEPPRCEDVDAAAKVGEIRARIIGLCSATSDRLKWKEKRVIPVFEKENVYVV